MRERPREFWHVAAVLVAIALSFPIQVMISYGFRPTEIPQMLAGLAPLNWIVIFTSLIHAYFVYQASPWVLFTTPVFLFSVIWNNWIVAWAGLNYSGVVVFFASVGAIATHAPLFRQEARRVLLNPRLRWWLTPPRKKVSLCAVIRPVMGGEIQSVTYDVSTGGAFFDMGHTKWNPLLASHKHHLKVGSRCSVRLVIDQTHSLTCNAEVVRHAHAMGEHPGGFAVRFVSLDDSQRKLLRSCVNSENLLAAAA